MGTRGEYYLKHGTWGAEAVVAAEAGLRAGGAEIGQLEDSALPLSLPPRGPGAAVNAMYESPYLARGPSRLIMADDTSPHSPASRDFLEYVFPAKGKMPAAKVKAPTGRGQNAPGTLGSEFTVSQPSDKEDIAADMAAAADRAMAKLKKHPAMNERAGIEKQVHSVIRGKLSAAGYSLPETDDLAGLYTFLSSDARLPGATR